jgi:hypothetical protein
LSLGSFLCALVLMGLLLWQADKLAALGMTGNFYYLVLLPLGLAVAGFLFGALRSFAHWRGEHVGGVLELGGPVVGFALALVGGFLLPPPTGNFPLAVYVHGPGGRHEILLRGEGFVVLHLGTELRRKPIGDNGQAFFPEVPASFRGQEVTIGLDAAGYALAEPGRKVHLEGTSLYLAAYRMPGRIAGRVQDQDGNPVAGASLTVAGQIASSDAGGNFTVTIPADRLRAELSMQVVADGYVPWRNDMVPDGDGDDAVVILQRKQ